MLTATRRRVAGAGATTAAAFGRGGRDPVVVVGIALVMAQSVFRAWALYGSWFYADDFALVDEARRPLTIDYLLEPYSIQVLPLGRFEAWVVERSGGLDWGAAASLTVGLSALCGLACLWMLLTLFGRRWLALAPLVLYLTSAISVPGTMWWAASLNQLPHQLAIALSVGCWVRYLRTSSRGWLALTAAAVLLGLGSYVKSALILPLLAFLLLAHFTSGSLRARVVDGVRRYWPAALLFSAVGVGFVVQYVVRVPDVTTPGDAADPAGLAGTMIGRSLATGLLGGPWTWSRLNAPVGFAEPSDLAVTVSWVVLFLGAVYLAAVRTRTGRVWLLLGGYALAAYVLLLLSRSPAVGATIGLEYRYLSDLSLVAALCLGLATMPLRGAVEPTERRPEPLLARSVPDRVLAGAAVVVAASGVLSSVQYVRIWHEDNPTAEYLQHARRALDAQPLDLADTTLPSTSFPAVLAPYNQARVLVPLVTDRASFPDWTRRLAMLDDQGNPRVVLIDPAATGVPDDDGGCGWQLLGRDDVAVDLSAEVFDWDWWVRLGYLASDAGQVEVTAGDSTLVADVEPGANNLYLRLSGSYDTLTITGLTDGVNLCLGQVEVGLPTPGALL